MVQTCNAVKLQSDVERSPKKKRFRPKSFFSLETFLDSRRSEASSADDFSSSKYCKFYLDSAESSPVFKGRNTPDLLDTPGISNASECKKRLDKLENHFNRIQRRKDERLLNENEKEADDDGIYSEPFYSSQSTLVLGSKANDASASRAPAPSGSAVTSRDAGVAYAIDIGENDVLINERTKELTVKKMDKSVDSIGSCSLDVEADTTDFSDTTSGSLNILTPSSGGSRFRDFTSRLQERAGPCLPRQELRPLLEEPRQKPSYLHLACSVNGYSNITTYDSKLRQKLNKSREASPGRPGNTADMLRDCTDDAMATRLNAGHGIFKNSYSESSISSQNAVVKTNGQKTTETHTSRSYHIIDTSPSKSFIQQRVERLYGPGALAQGFFNQKRVKTKSQCEDEKIALNGGKVVNHLKSPETLHQISRTHFLNKSPNGTYSQIEISEGYMNGENCDPALPVLRHLRPEFRAQLPILSPKRSLPLRSIDSDANASDPECPNSLSNCRLSGYDVVDKAASRKLEIAKSPAASEKTKQPLVTIIPIEREMDVCKIVPSVNGTIKLDAESVKLKVNGSDAVKERLDDNCNRVGAPDQPAAGAQQDGNYFLELKRRETERLIRLAETAERDLEELQGRGDASEEVLGFLRAAAGKARLLATQKMQQFEGLCHNNMNRREDEPFPTTCSDLQGFWDMVSLQLGHVAHIFSQLEEMRAGGWTQVPADGQPAEPARAARPRRRAAPPAAAPDAAAAARRAAQRRAAIAAARRAAAAGAAPGGGRVEIFAPARADRAAESEGHL